MVTFFCKTGNTRVIKQSSLQKFQEEMDTVLKDPYKVVMKQSKLPMSLLHDRIRPHVRRRMSLADHTDPSLPYLALVFSMENSVWCSTDELSETSPFAVIKGLTFSMNRILSERFSSMVDQSTGLTFNLFAVALSAALKSGWATSLGDWMQMKHPLRLLAQSKHLGYQLIRAK